MESEAALSDARLIALFDAVERLPPVAQAQRLAAAVLPKDADVMSLTLGDRDRLLWAFKASRFGRRAVAHFECEACAEAVSFAIPNGFEVPDAVTDKAMVRHDDRDWHLRPPRLSDVQTGQFETAICADAPWEDATFRAAAAQALDDADPGMDVVFEVACADCGHVNPRGLDVAAFVMSDLNSLAARIFADVAILARAFGWSEADVLQLSPARRARYVEMVS